nr:hypothetical protein [Tanacetum cinerariifolium]
APKPKASARKKRGGSASSTTPPTLIATLTPTTTVVATPRLSAAAKGKQPARATSPTDPSNVERTEAEQLKLVLRRSRHEMHISQQGGSGTDEGTGSKPGVPDVPSDDSEEELSWNSSDDEDVDEQAKGRDESEGEKTDESDDNEEKDNDGDEEDEGDDGKEGNGDDDEDDDGEEGDDDDADQEVIRDDDKDDDEEGGGNGEEDLGLNISEEERHIEEEEEDELYRDININQGRGLQASLEVEDSHVTLTLVNPDESDEGDDEATDSDRESEDEETKEQEEESFDLIPRTPEDNKDDDNNEEDQGLRIGLESLFTTGSTTVTPIPSPQSIMTPSIISTFTSASLLPTPPTQIPSLDLQSLPTFASVKTKVKAQVTRIMPRIEEAVNAQLEAEVLTRSSHSSRTSYAVEADLSEMELKKILIEKMEGNKSIQRSDEQRNLYKAEEERMMIRKDPPLDQTGGLNDKDKKGSMHQLALHLNQLPGVQAELPQGADDQPIIQTTQHPEWFSQPRRPPTPDRDWNKSVPVAYEKAQSWLSALAKQTDAPSSFNELLNTPIDFSNFIMNRLDVDTLTPELLAGPTYELMRGSWIHLPEQGQEKQVDADR